MGNKHFSNIKQKNTDTQEEAEGRESRKLLAHLARLTAADCFASLFRMYISIQDFSLVTWQNNQYLPTCEVQWK